MNKKKINKDAYDFIELTNLLEQISPIQLKTKHILEELSKDEVLYIFLLVCTKYSNELDLGFKNISSNVEDITMEQFKKSSKNMPAATKKITKEAAINQLLEIPTIENTISLGDISSFNFASHPLTFALFNIIRWRLGIINGNDSLKIEEYLKKILNSNSKNTNITLLELFILLEVTFCAYNENSEGNIIGISKADTQQAYDMVKALKATILVPMLGTIILCINKTRINEINNIIIEASKFENEIKKLDDLEEEVKLLKEENKNLRKTQLSPDSIKKYNADIAVTIKQAVSEHLKPLTALDTFKTDILSSMSKNVNNASAKAYENQINTLTTKVADLRANVVVKDNKIKDLEKEIEDLKKYAEEAKSTIVEISPNETNQDVKIDEEQDFSKLLDKHEANNNPKIRLGYVDVENEKLVIKFLDDFMPKQGKLVITERYCPSLHQIVYVKESYNTPGSFILEDAVSSTHNANTNLKACIIKEIINNRDFVVEYSGRELTCAIGATTHFNRPINIGDIIYCNVDSEKALMLPKSAGLWAEKFVDTVKASGNRLVFIESLLGNTAFLKEIATGNQFIEELEFDNHTVTEHCSCIISKNGKVLTLFISPRFYTGSEFYPNDKIKIATIITVGMGKYIANDINENKLFEVTGVPNNTSLREGDVVKVDEWNEYIYRIDSNGNENTRKTSFKTVPRTKETSNTNINPLGLLGTIKPNKTKVAIIGNTSFANSYSTALAKEGYELIMVDGYDSVPSAKRLIKDAEIVVCCTGCCSHEIAWYAKDLDDKKVLMLPKSTDGATRITQLIMQKGW